MFLMLFKFLSRIESDTYFKIVNSILLNTEPLKRRGKLTFIVDATPVNLDYNVNIVLRNILKNRILNGAIPSLMDFI